MWSMLNKQKSQEKRENPCAFRIKCPHPSTPCLLSIIIRNGDTLIMDNKSKTSQIVINAINMVNSNLQPKLHLILKIFISMCLF